MPRARMGLLDQRAIAARLGFREWLRYRINDARLSWAAPGDEVMVRSSLARHQLLCRAHTSDHFVFAQVFKDLSYAAVPNGQQPELIVDCGANVGYSAAYFLSRFDRCRVIAIEPDRANYRCLELNLAAYGRRATCINGALWSHAANLQMIEQEYRVGGHWSRQVEECAADCRVPIPGFDIPAIMHLAAAERISILKIDIEGAEAVVFNHPNLEWLDRVDTIMIELHDDSVFGNSTPIFHKAIADRGFRIWRDGELQGEVTVCSRLAPA